MPAIEDIDIGIYEWPSYQGIDICDHILSIAGQDTKLGTAFGDFNDDNAPETRKFRYCYDFRIQLQFLAPIQAFVQNSDGELTIQIYNNH
jgi:hypothetical protein